jgi:ABC-type transport system involved in multi-copper enzyme maturation permease subunit
VLVKRTTLWRVIHSELIKLATLRSTWLVSGAICLSLVGLGAISAAASIGQLHGDVSGSAHGVFSSSNPTDTILAGATLVVLLVAVFGVLCGAREYGSGAIRATLTTVPGRWQVVVGKAAAMCAFVLPALAIGVVGAWFGGNAMLGRGSGPLAHFGSPGVSGAVIGIVFYLLGIGLMGLALGVVLRSVALGSAVVIGAVLVVPSLAESLAPRNWSDGLKFLPSNAGTAFSAVHSSSPVLGYWIGALVFCGWLAVFFAGAIVAIRRRDA